MNIFFLYFNLRDHYIERDFCFYIFTNMVDGAAKRRFIEKLIIYLFIKLKVEIINNYIPKVYIKLKE